MLWYFISAFYSFWINWSIDAAKKTKTKQQNQARLKQRYMVFRPALLLLHVGQLNHASFIFFIRWFQCILALHDITSVELGLTCHRGDTLHSITFVPSYIVPWNEVVTSEESKEEEAYHLSSCLSIVPTDTPSPSVQRCPHRLVKSSHVCSDQTLTLSRRKCNLLLKSESRSSSPAANGFVEEISEGHRSTLTDWSWFHSKWLIAR